MSGERDDKPVSGAGFWALTAIAALSVVMAAAPGARRTALQILTFPFRVVGWALPGEGLYADAAAAGVVAGWVGWGLLGLAATPALFVVWRAIAGFIQPLHALAQVWTNIVRGRHGAWLGVLAGALAAVPLFVAAAGVALGLLRPVTIPAAMLLFAVAACGALFGQADSPLAALLRRLADAVDAVSDLLGDAVRWAALALVVLVTTVVIQRYVFGVAFTKLQELVAYLHAALFMLIASATLKSDGHVRVDVLYGRMSPAGRAWVNLIGFHILLAPAALIILLTSQGYVDVSWRVGEGSSDTDGLALVFLLKTLIPVFAVIIFAQGASLSARAALRIVGEDPGDEDQPAHHELA